MNALEAAIPAIWNALNSHVQTLGYFDIVQMHEPKSAPPNGPTGLACAMFLADLRPIPMASGLDATSVRIEITARICRSFKAAPEDMIDVNMAMACAAIMGSLTSDFDLGGTIRNVDLMGAHGNALAARAGYQKIDTANYRIMDVTIPMIISDVFDQEA